MSLFPTDGRPFVLALNDEKATPFYATIHPDRIDPVDGCTVDDLLWSMLVNALDAGTSQWDRRRLRGWTNLTKGVMAHPMGGLKKDAITRVSKHLIPKTHALVAIGFRDGAFCSNGQEPVHVPLHDLLSWRIEHTKSYERILYQGIASATPTTLALAFGLWDALMEHEDNAAIHHAFNAVMVHAAPLTGLVLDTPDTCSDVHTAIDSFSHGLVKSWIVRPNRMPSPTALVGTPRYHAIASPYRDHPAYAVGRTLPACAQGCPILSDVVDLHDDPSWAQLAQLPSLPSASAHHRITVAVWNQRIHDAVLHTLQRSGLPLQG